MIFYPFTICSCGALLLSIKDDGFYNMLKSGFRIYDNCPWCGSQLHHFADAKAKITHYQFIDRDKSLHWKINPEK